MTKFQLHLVSEPVSTYEFDDPRSLQEVSDDTARFGYCTFEGASNRLGNANRAPVRQTVFLANIARIVER